MKKIGIGLGLAGALLSILLAGCVAQPEITPAAPPPTPAVVVGEANGNGDGDGDGDEAGVLASRFPLPAPAVEEAQTNSENCIDCHTDQEALESLAEEPEEVHLSEGEG
jgi:hypothetical protein